MPSDFWIRTMQDADSGRLKQALESARVRQRLHPKDIEAMVLLGVLLRRAGDHAQSAHQLRRATELQPGNPVLLRSLAESLMLAQQAGEAIAAWREACALDPGSGDAWLELTTALLITADVDGAAQAAAEGLRHFPDWPPLCSNHAVALARAGRTDDAIASMRRCLRAHPDAADLRSNMLLMLQYAETDAATVLHEHQAFGASMPAPQPPAARPAATPLRVGVLSSDLRGHAVGSFVEPLFRHAPAGTQVIAFSNQAHGHQDPVRLRLQKSTHAWHDVHTLDDAALDALIRRERIDVLLELNGHTADNRLPALARKPAPSIVTAIGYPDTTGLPAVDARIVDSITDPPGSERWCTERPLRIDPCFLCYTPLADAPAPALPPHDAAFTFGSFNNAAKIGPSTAALWARVMHAVPESRLLLKSTGLSDPAVQRVLRQRFTDAGLPLERVEMVGYTTDQMAHLALYNRVHVALDTVPYNGTTTTCEALWMGVPVITTLGDRHAARVSASLLHAAGFPEWVASDAADFARIAARLASDRTALATLRTGMRDRLRASTLLDAPAYAARLHAALRSLQPITA